MANLKNVIYLSNEDYNTLATTGTVTIGSETLVYDENNLYITPDGLASATEDGLMSSSDKIKLDEIDLSKYLPLSGGTMTGNIVLSNNKYISGKTSSSLEVSLFGPQANNNIQLGNTSFNDIVSYNRILPNATNRYDLGASALQWNEIYGKTLYENGVSLSSKYVPLSGGTMSGFLGTYQNNMKYYPWVNGGFASYYGGTSTGKIFITLPEDIPYGMIKFKVGIYNYATDTSCEFEIAGYTYTDGNWYNVTVNSYGKGYISARKVTFYKALNNKYVIAIGELDSTWEYPQIMIKDLQVGFSGVSRTWNTGWEIIISATEIENEVYGTWSNNGFLPLKGGVMSGSITLPNDTNSYNSKGLLFSGGSRIGESSASANTLGIYSPTNIYFGTGSSSTYASNRIYLSGNIFAPENTNNISLGASSNRWSDIYASNNLYMLNNEGAGVQYTRDGRISLMSAGAARYTLTLPSQDGTLATTSDIKNGGLTIKVEGTALGTFYANDNNSYTWNITAASLGLTGAIKFLGITTTDISDGSTTRTITINGVSVTADKGNVVIKDGGSQEFLWTGDRWEQLGDEISYALKNVTITGDGVLQGGGSLEANRTITHKTVLGTAQGTAGIYKTTFDAYGHVASAVAATGNDLVTVAGNSHKILTSSEYNNLAKTNITNDFSNTQIFLKTIGIYDNDSEQEFDYDMFIHSERISIDNVDSGYSFNYYFPYLDGDTDKDYTLATTEDIDSARIPIYDLT